MNTKFGALFSGSIPLERTLSGAVLAERLGFDSCWIGEDYFYHGAISTATAIAERTNRIGIGLGVLSPLPRHPALTAMEVATVDEIAQGRVTLGMGYGLPAWMQQMGIGCRSPLSAMREAVALCRRLMAGERVSETGVCFSLDRARLGFTPLRRDMPIYLGVEGPKGLQLSGEIADGTIISVLAGARYLEWAREHVAKGRERAGSVPVQTVPGGRGGTLSSGRPIQEHQFVVYVIFSMDDDSARAHEAVRHTIAEYVSAGASGGAAPHPLVSHGGVPQGVYREMGRIYREGRIPVELVDEAMVDQLAVSGNPDECEAGVRRLIDARADAIVFFPFPIDQVERQLEQISRELLPRLGRALHSNLPPVRDGYPDPPR